MLGQPCPDAEALRQRLHRAITNSKAKKYHGSSEHMNELPPLNEQAKAYLLAEPSPFLHYDSKTKKFTLDGADPAWRTACMKKFDWIRRAVDQGAKKVTPAALALQSDMNEIEGGRKEQSLAQHVRELQQAGHSESDLAQETVYEDYGATFSWRDLFHKLCFEQMVASFDKLLDF